MDQFGFFLLELCLTRLDHLLEDCNLALLFALQLGYTCVLLLHQRCTLESELIFLLVKSIVAHNHLVVGYIFLLQLKVLLIER